ncbi:hypothetical protein SAMN05421780_101814, partial [Flexibacter flexilis DSM 6793]
MFYLAFLASSEEGFSFSTPMQKRLLTSLLLLLGYLLPAQNIEWVKPI